MTLVLCSASPRRRELLAQAGVPFVLHAVDLDESVRPGEAPTPYVRRLAEAKARAAREQVKQLDHTYLGADTTVVAGDRILGKPVDADDADAMLASLSGGWHEVTTGFCVLRGETSHVAHVTTRVEMRVIGPAERAAYLASGEWEGKAGGYAIQGLAGALVRQIAGSYSNVVGLPVCEVVESLLALGGLPPDWRLGGV